MAKTHPLRLDSYHCWRFPTWAKSVAAFVPRSIYPGLIFQAMPIYERRGCGSSSRDMRTDSREEAEGQRRLRHKHLVLRQLVVGEQREYTQKELVDLTGLDQGFLSRVLRSLVEKGLVEQRGKVYEVTSRSLLLESWQEVYDFTKHQIIKGHIPARTSEDLLSTLSATLDHDGVVSAATGLAGAWLLTHFASFRLATFYVSHHPSQDHLATLGFREEEKGANTWLVIPNDEAVFTGREEREGVSCAHPVQVYLDLRFHPERSREAAERVRALYLNGEDDA